MSKKSTVRRSSRSARRKGYTRNPLTGWLRRPAVQLGILGLAALIVVLLILGANGGASATLSPQDAYTLYSNNEAFFLDVREVEEWNEYHAPHSTLIPLDELQARVNEIPRDRPIVVVCRSGNRSQEGRNILRRAGFTNVTSLSGGLQAWRSLGYPLEP